MLCVLDIIVEKTSREAKKESVRIFIHLFGVLLWAYLLVGCSVFQKVPLPARSSFPLKYFYHPSYSSIGAMYAKDAALSIELLERLSRKEPENLSYRLTLADMYQDRGRVNDAIRLWFEILDMSRQRGIIDGKNVPVYFIPMPPDQQEGMRAYGRRIDKALAYSNIGRIYSQNAFYLQAAEYYSTAAAHSSDTDRKADLYNRGGRAIGLQKMDFFISEEDGKAYRKEGNRIVPVDPTAKLHRELAFYEMAAALPVKDTELAGKIRKNLARVRGELAAFQPPSTKKAKKEEKPLPLQDRPEEPTGDLWKQALVHFRAGEMDQAVALWDRLAADFSDDDFLVEVELDCESGSLHNTFAKLRRPDDFFLLSRPFKGKTCYRLCLGLYQSREEAEERVQEVRKALGSDEVRLRNAALFQKAKEPSKGES